MISFVVFFLAAFMLAFSPQIIILLLGEKWLPAVPFMRVVCCTVCVNPLIVINQTISTSLGRSDYYIKTTIVSKFMAIGLIALSSLYNVYLMVIAGAIANVLTFIITAKYNKSLIGYTYKEILKDDMPSLILSAIACGITYLIITLISNHYLIELIIGALLSVTIYLLLSLIFKQQSLAYLREIVIKKK
mgnify:CR=1 FL=1